MRSSTQSNNTARRVSNRPASFPTPAATSSRSSCRRGPRHRLKPLLDLEAAVQNTRARGATASEGARHPRRDVQSIDLDVVGKPMSYAAQRANMQSIFAGPTRRIMLGIARKTRPRMRRNCDPKTLRTHDHELHILHTTPRYAITESSRALLCARSSNVLSARRRFLQQRRTGGEHSAAAASCTQRAGGWRCGANCEPRRAAAGRCRRKLAAGRPRRSCASGRWHGDDCG